MNTVAARMAALGLAGRPPKKRRSLTRTGRRPAAPDLVHRNFTAVAPDVLWCGDVTQIDTGEGPLFLATTEDLFSRRMLGHAMSAHQQTFTTRAEARIKISTWIADFHNTTRQHTANDGLAPITFERQMAQKRRASTAQLRAQVA